MAALSHPTRLGGQPWPFLFFGTPLMNATKPALGELAKRLADYRIKADPCQIATIMMDIVKDKHPQEFTNWMSQLAVDVLHEKTADEQIFQPPLRY